MTKLLFHWRFHVSVAAASAAMTVGVASSGHAQQISTVGPPTTKTFQIPCEGGTVLAKAVDQAYEEQSGNRMRPQVLRFVWVPSRRVYWLNLAGSFPTRPAPKFFVMGDKIVGIQGVTASVLWFLISSEGTS